MQQQISIRLRAAALALMAMLPLPAAAQDALTLFEEFLTHAAGTMHFVQTSSTHDGTFLEEVRGSLSYQRPGKFRLEYDDPAHPLITSDGSTIWLYESDLQQVIVSSSDAVQKNGLWQVLAEGDTAILRRDYVLSASVSGAVRWLTATTQHEGESVREVALGFAAESGALQQVRIVDTFGGIAELKVETITFSADAAQFQFTPPVGSTIVEHAPQMAQ